MNRNYAFGIFAALATVAGAGRAEAKSPGGLSVVTVNAEKREYLLREPVRVTFVWTNASTRAAVLSARAQTVSLKLGNKATRYELFVSSTEELSSGLRGGVLLRPGEASPQDIWLLLGRPVGKPEGWQFLFDAPGKYGVNFPGLGGETFVINVSRAREEKDFKACSLFSAEAAAMVLGESNPGVIRKGRRALEEICQQFPASRYAPYAARKMAGVLWSKGRGFKVDFPAYREYVNIMLLPNVPGPLREEGFYLLARGYAFESGKKHKVAETLNRLIKDYPGSPKIGQIEKHFGVKAGAGAPATSGRLALAVERRTAAASLAIDGGEKLPKGAREAYTAYWTGIAAGELDKAGEQLHREFVGLYGGKRGWRQHWQQARDERNIDSIAVNIGKVATTGEYVRPHLVASKRKSWKGRLCLVSARASFGTTTLKTGKKDTVSTALPLTAMIEEDGKWSIVSEYREPSRNQHAGTLMLKLEQDMRKSFKTATLLDADGKRTGIHGLIRSRIGASDDVALLWRPGGHRMKGESFDEPEVKGHVTLKPVDDSQTKPSRYSVVMNFILKDDQLRLRTLNVAPEK